MRSNRTFYMAIANLVAVIVVLAGLIGLCHAQEMANFAKSAPLTKTQIEKLQPAVGGFKYIVLEIYINDEGKIIQALTRELPAASQSRKYGQSTQESTEKSTPTYTVVNGPWYTRTREQQIGDAVAEHLLNAGVGQVGAGAVYIVTDSGKNLAAFTVKRFANNYVARNKLDHAKIETIPLNPLE